MIPQITCATCGNVFYKPPSLTRSSGVQFCSKACQVASYPPKVKLACDTCGNSYEKPPCLVIPDGRHYCSRKCASEGHKRPNIVHCTVCSKTMTRRNCEVKRSQQPFCSKKCQGIWSAEHENKRVIVACAQCGEPVQRKRHKIKDNIHQFCDRKCMHEWQSQNWIGPNHHSWRGGSAALRDYGPNWKQQARTARKRDGYKCRYCGKAPKKHARALDVHHIRSFRNFGYVRGQNDHYKAANELTNLVTLCRDCHAKAENGLIPLQPYLL